MKKENIETLLNTICQYSNVRITQTFTKGSTDWIKVKCVPGTQTLELTFLETGAVEYYESVRESMEVIHKSISPSIAC